MEKSNRPEGEELSDEWIDAIVKKHAGHGFDDFRSIARAAIVAHEARKAQAEDEKRSSKTAPPWKFMLTVSTPCGHVKIPVNPDRIAYAYPAFKRLQNGPFNRDVGCTVCFSTSEDDGIRVLESLDEVAALLQSTKEPSHE